MFPTYYSRPMLNTGSKTWAQTDGGTVQNVNVDGAVVTLPAAAATLVGATVTVRNGGANNGDVGFTVAANAADGVNGLGFTSAVGKGVVNTKATARPGDEISFVCSGVTGVNAWNINNAVGTFARVP